MTETREQGIQQMQNLTQAISTAIGAQPMHLAFSAVGYYFVAQLQEANSPELTRRTARDLRNLADIIDSLHPSA